MITRPASIDENSWVELQEWYRSEEWDLEMLLRRGDDIEIIVGRWLERDMTLAERYDRRRAADPEGYKYLDGLIYAEPVMDDQGHKHCAGCGSDLTVGGSVGCIVDPVADSIFEYQCENCPTFWKRDGPRWIDHYLVGGMPS